MIWTPLILDQFFFDEARLEVPEHFADVGGAQRLSQHDFPGGTRTQKSFGYFPSALRWRAKSHAIDANDRIEAMRQIVAAGREIRLQWGIRAWMGRVAHIIPTVRSDWLYEYEIEFWPRVDLGVPGPGYPPATDVGTIIALHMLALQSLIQNGLDPSFAFQAVAIGIGGPTGLFLSQLDDALAGAGGSIANISIAVQTALYQSSLSALAACQPYQQSSDPVLSSPASDAAARIQAIQNLMFAGQPPLATVQTVNPNLPVLAAQYYGDGSQWRYIATANGLADPQPIGSYNLVIPQQPS